MLPTRPRALRSFLLPRLPIVAVFTSPAQLDSQLLSRAFQGGCAAFAATSVAARKPAAELSDGGDDQVREGIVGQPGDEFVPLGAGQARGHHVDAVA